MADVIGESAEKSTMIARYFHFQSKTECKMNKCKLLTDVGDSVIDQLNNLVNFFDAREEEALPDDAINEG